MYGLLGSGYLTVSDLGLTVVYLDQSRLVEWNSLLGDGHLGEQNGRMVYID